MSTTFVAMKQSYIRVIRMMRDGFRLYVGTVEHVGEGMESRMNVLRWKLCQFRHRQRFVTGKVITEMREAGLMTKGCWPRLTSEAHKWAIERKL